MPSGGRRLKPRTFRPVKSCAPSFSATTLPEPLVFFAMAPSREIPAAELSCSVCFPPPGRDHLIPMPAHQQCACSLAATTAAYADPSCDGTCGVFATPANRKDFPKLNGERQESLCGEGVAFVAVHGRFYAAHHHKDAPLREKYIGTAEQSVTQSTPVWQCPHCSAYTPMGRHLCGKCGRGFE